MALQLSCAAGEAEPPLLEDTIGGNLALAASRFPEREALVDRPSGRRWSYRAFDTQVDALALGLLRAGIRTGDRVGIWAPNCAEWMFTQYASARIGAIGC
jgi:fatty-acyl-CoA synthase